MRRFPDATYMPVTNGRAEWLEQRRLGLGGSDASTIMGFNRYTSTLDLYDDKRAKFPVDLSSPSEAADWGRFLENAVCERLEQVIQTEVDENLWLKPPDGMLQNIERPWMLASLDRVVYSDDSSHGLFPVGIAEAKTVGHRMARDWEDGSTAMAALWQVIHYMAVTGLPVAYIGALVGGNEFRFREIRRDEVVDLEEQLIAAEEKFWNHVQEGVEPPLVGGWTDTNMSSLKRRYPESVPSTTVEVDRDIAEAIEQYREQAAICRDAEKAKDAAKERIAEVLGDAEAATFGGEVLATYKSSIRREVDREAVKAHVKEHPEDAKFMKTNIVRTLRVR